MEAAEELEADEQQSAGEVWGDRAQQLVDFVKAQKPPIAKLQTIVVFARRKGWEHPTLTGILEYCEKQKLLAGYRSIHGAAWKIPMTPVFDTVDPGAPPAAPDGCLCSSTAPKKNYGCSLHGGARIATTTKKETAMSKDWITCIEAGELLGIGPERVGVLARAGKLESRKDESYTGKGHKPLLVSLAGVIARRDAEKAKGDMLDDKPRKSAKVKAPPPAACEGDRRARRQGVEATRRRAGGRPGGRRPHATPLHRPRLDVADRSARQTPRAGRLT